MMVVDRHVSEEVGSSSLRHRSNPGVDRDRLGRAVLVFDLWPFPKEDLDVVADELGRIRRPGAGRHRQGAALDELRHGGERLVDLFRKSWRITK